PAPEPEPEPKPEPAPEAIPETVVAEPRPDAIEEAAAPDAQPSYDYVPSKDVAVAEGGGGFSGGAMCSSGARPASGGLAGAAALGLLFVAFVLATRARRRLVPLAAAVVPLLVPAGAEARPIDLDRHRPSEAARDGLTLSSAETPGHLCYDVLLHFDYA
ncbi:MAG: hypothetical protein FJ087_20335, partial [Deltaproteobacteria bacterium]|nr:hypothetical protein [Deltaproteobacteria bacterium]